MKTKRIVVGLTQEILKEHIHYDPIAGRFVWEKPRALWMKVGDPAGTVDAHGALVIGLHGKKHYAHRLAWLYMTGRWPRNVIDHKDGDASNNRFANLRDVQRYANQQNTKRRPKGAKRDLPFGVTMTTQSERFMTRIRVRGKEIYLGCFGTPEEAHERYIEAKRALHDLPEGWKEGLAR